MSSMTPERPAKPPKKGTQKPKSQYEAKTNEEIARLFGQSYVIMEQDEDLKNWFLDFARRFNEARGEIRKEKFMLELEQRPWWINNSATYIADLQKELENPTDYKQSIAGDVANLKASANALGAVGINDQLLEDLVKQQRRLGWNEQQTLEKLTEFISPVDGDFRGVAGATQDTLESWARANGLTISPNMVQDYVRKISSGATTIDDVKDDLRKTYLMGQYPGWADRIAQGMDPESIAAPYKAKMASLLEMDEEMIDLNDDLMKRAMQGVDADGKPKIIPLYEFEREIRNDQRWQYTENARKTYSSMADELLRMFGFR